jgi:hypothetical protein
MTHTKTAWTVERRHLHGDARFITTLRNGVPTDVAKLPYNAGIPDAEVDANAQRIASCISVCDGLPQEAIDDGWSAKSITQYVMFLESQRHGLLLALQDLLAATDGCDINEAFPDTTARCKALVDLLCGEPHSTH